MLGYLEAKKWVDAIKAHDYSRHEVFALAKIQDDTYSSDIVGEIKALLEEE